MPYEAIGTTFPVVRSQLVDPADIETAFEEFYLGIDVNGASGLEYHIKGLDTRITALEATLGGASEFADNLFTIKNASVSTKKFIFSAASISSATTRTVTVPDANFTILGHDTIQTVSNKTLNNTNAANLKGTSQTWEDSGGTKKMRFGLENAYASTLVVDVPSATGTQYMVLTDATQTITKKVFGGYSESLYSATGTGGTTTIDASLYNTAQITLSSGTTNTIAFSNLPSTPYSCLIVFINSSGNTRSLAWPTMKWASGSSLSSVAAGARNLVALTYANSTYYATSLGAFS